MIARRRHDRFFARALMISLIFHLSAVTLFRIVFRVPHKDIEYFNVAIVEAAEPGRGSGAPSGQLSVAGPDLTTADSPEAALPPIHLPALKFRELSKLRMRQEALESRSRFDELLAGSPDDIWSKAAGSFSALGQTLSRLTFGEAKPAPAAPAPISRPAPGFEAYIEWGTEPRDRKVLTVVPVEELWGVSPAALPEPVTIGFNVNRDGKVTRIITFSPIDDPKGYADACGEALRNYRFEPLLGDGPPVQSGTLIIRAAAGDTL